MPEPNQTIPVERSGARSDMRAFLSDAPLAAVVFIPAMGVAARFYDRFAEALSRRNFAVFVSELRGIGSSTIRASRKNDFGYLDLLEDARAAVRVVRARSPHLPIVVVGHSLGGHLAMLYAGLHPDEIAGAAVVAGGTPYFRNWESRMRGLLWVGSSIMRASGMLLGYVPGNRLGFGGREANRVVAEWARFVRTNELVIRGIDHREMTGRLGASTLPVLGVSLEGDDYAPRVSTDRLVAKLPQARLTRVHLPAAVFPEPVDHFRWAKSSGPVVDEIQKWISAIANS